MSRLYTARQRVELEAELSGGAAAPRCPVCLIEVSVQAVAPPAEVAYVRRRILVICPQCRRSASLDLKQRRPPG